MFLGRQSISSRLKTAWLGCLSGLCLWAAGPAPGQAAERIYVSFSLFERSISVQNLEVFAKEGRIQGDLASYARYLNKQQLQQFREGLVTPLDLDPLAVAQFFYTPVGEGLLQRVEQVVQTKSRQGSLYALRSALILAAADPEGLTALTVLKHYPTEGVQVDLASALTLFRSAQQALKDTEKAIQAIQAETPTVPETAVTGQILQQEGPSAWRTTTLELEDSSTKRLSYTGRARKFSVDLYFPTAQSQTPRSVVVISHGFNSDRDTYAYLAEHLASHGYVVVVPEHSGSNSDQLQALLTGRASDIIESTEFIDRPLDVSFALDELKGRSQNNPDIGPLDLENVGMFGHSFGGYTALVLGGGSINFKQLYQDCANLKTTLNLSLLLQCQARELIPQNYELGDARIKSILAVNPIGSSLLGPDLYGKINVPVMLVSGGSDTVAPALSEQIGPFDWLNIPDKYLMLMVGGDHFSTIGIPDPDKPDSIGEVLKFAPPGPAAEEARQDLGTVTLAFMNVFIEGQTEDRQYLTPGYIATLSQPILPLALTQTFSLQATMPERSTPEETPSEETVPTE
jgi:predicted dienelactone hydrolase